MAVVADDLKKPKGPVSNLLFPGVDSNVLDANLTAYIATAETDPRITAEPDASKTDRLVRALALYLTFQDAYIEANARPLQINVAEKGGHGYSAEQIKNLRVLAQNFLDEFLLLLTPNTGTARRGGTKSVATNYTF